MNSSVYVAEERSPSARSKAGIARRQYASKAISYHGRFAVLLCVLVSFLLFAHPTQAWLRSDIPPNNANRSLTRISIPRTYSLTESEMKKLSKQESKVLGQDDFALLAFTSTAIDKNDIRRAVIVLHGQGRDAWLYHDQAVETLYNATRSKNGPDQADRNKLKRYQTLVLAPMFTNGDDSDIVENMNDLQFDDIDDLSVYNSLSHETSLQWSVDDWSEGGDTIAPESISDLDDDSSKPITAPNLSSFEAMDALISQLVDKKTYPNLETIIIAGHSMGAQYVQRYALIGAVPSKSVPVHFVVANPGSFAYLTHDRPYSVDACPDSYDSWRYGLGVFGIRYLGDIVRESLDSTSDLIDVRVRYLRDRQVHYLYGTADFGQGDTHCEALTQGKSHLQRGKRYDTHIRDVAKELGTTLVHTTDYVPNVSHDPLNMFGSRRGIQRMFLSNIDGNEGPAGTGDADADFSRYPYRFSASARLEAVSLNGLLLLLGIMVYMLFL